MSELAFWIWTGCLFCVAWLSGIFIWYSDKPDDYLERFAGASLIGCALIAYAMVLLEYLG